jgi:hypothetical protein
VKGPTARRRAAKAGRLKRAENKNKQFVRDRDLVCRFPACSCQRFDLFLEVSHAEHKGMGGDPTGERSAPEKLILVCNWRHKEGRYAIDRKNIRWRPLTAEGSNGPVAWDIRAPWLFGHEWFEIARETAIRRWEAPTEGQRAVLELLSAEVNGLLDKKCLLR